MGTTVSCKLGLLQSVKPGYHTIDIYHTATCSGTANTVTTETITLDKTYEKILPVSIVAGNVAGTAGGMVNASFVNLKEAGATGSTISVAVNSSTASEAIALRITLMVKEVGA